MTRRFLLPAGLALISAVVLSGCGLAEARTAALANASVKPVDMANALRPGLVGMSDYPATGWEPGPLASETPTSPKAQTLAAVGLRASDVAASLHVATLQDGTSLGIPTLDFCGASYPSESLRVKRLQVGAFDATGAYAGISTEVVQYKDAAAARQAITEVAAAATSCPRGKVVDTGDGHKITFTFHPAPGPSDTPLVDANARLIVHVTMDVDGSPQSAFLVYQVVGRMFAGMYASNATGDPFPQTDLDASYALAGDIADRLRAFNGVRA